MIANSVEIGFVVATYPEGNSIDVLLEDGSRLSNVQVMVPTGSDSTGIVDLPDVGLGIDDSRWELTSNPDRYMRAIIAVYRRLPICLGFLLPQENQISFQAKNRRIMRHASDVYTSIDADGNTEISHPSGTFIRIATSPAHDDLAGTDFDQKWAIEQNTAKQVHVQLTVANGGQVKASVNIAPNGNITIQHQGDLDIQTGGSATLTAQDVTINADLTVDGEINASGDVVADGISLKNHTHPGVQTGSGSTQKPE